ncbi:MAG: hypothetical protein ACTHU0_14315 [Kofleriaceae bacterium]
MHPVHRPRSSSSALVAIATFTATFTAACAGGRPVSPSSPAPPAASTSAAAQPAAPPPSPRTFVYTTARTGDAHDFDFLFGAWTGKQRRLKARGVGSNEWDEFPSVLCSTPYLGGIANAEEVAFPTKGWSGLTLRTFDTEKRQWSIYWINSRTGTLFPPQIGGFDGDHGEFYGEDLDDGRPVKVVFQWTKLGPDHAHWEQAFSSDDGQTWEVNWTAEFTRAAPSICEGGRPKK